MKIFLEIMVEVNVKYYRKFHNRYIFIKSEKITDNKMFEPLSRLCK